jgi:hypothetical protein
VPKLAGLSLKDAGRRHRAEVLDMVVNRASSYRLIRRWFAEEKRFCIWMTNLQRHGQRRVMSLYCRWQVELLFKEWKSHNWLKGFVTGQKAIAEGLWASLLSLVMKRRVAQTLMGDGLSTLKAAKIAEPGGSQGWKQVYRGAVEIRERLEWAAVYL